MIFDFLVSRREFLPDPTAMNRRHLESDFTHGLMLSSSRSCDGFYVLRGDSVTLKNVSLLMRHLKV